VRGLLLGTAIGNNAVLAVAWCVVIGVASYVWARRLFDRPPVTRPSVLAMTPGGASR
jgi:ABC-2 type transport system permease protein